MTPKIDGRALKFMVDSWAAQRLAEWRAEHPEDGRDDEDLILAADGPFVGRDRYKTHAVDAPPIVNPSTGCPDFAGAPSHTTGGACGVASKPDRWMVEDRKIVRVVYDVKDGRGRYRTEWETSENDGSRHCTSFGYESVRRFTRSWDAARKKLIKELRRDIAELEAMTGPPERKEED